MTSGVYVVRNLVNGRQYVGSSERCLNERLRSHRTKLAKGSHGNKILQAAWHKYGEAVFSFEMLVACSPQECLPTEQQYIDAAAPGMLYNICLVAGNRSGAKHSDETKALIARKKTGVPGGRRSEETKLRMSAWQKGHRPDAAIAAAANKRRGTREDPAVTKKRSDKRGRKRPREVVDKYVAKIQSPEVRARLSAAAKAQWSSGRGWKRSDVISAHMSDGQKRRIERRSSDGRWCS